MKKLTIPFRNYAIIVEYIQYRKQLFVNLNNFTSDIISFDDLTFDNNVINYINITNNQIFNKQTLLIDSVYKDKKHVRDLFSSPYITNDFTLGLQYEYNVEYLNNNTYNINQFKNQFFNNKPLTDSVIGIVDDKLWCHIRILFKLIYKHMKERYTSEYDENEPKVNAQIKSWMDVVRQHSVDPEIIELREEVAQLREENKQLREENVRLKEKNTRLQEEVTRLTELVLQLQEENRQLREENRQLREEIRQLREEKSIFGKIFGWLF